MEILRAEARGTERGNPDYFTGTVWLDAVAAMKPPARVRAARVSFEPRARTAWHTHPLGQVLHILSGVGCVQREGEPVQVVRPGDTVIFAPGERHWHGAAPKHGMVHLAIQEADESGSPVTWLEKVTDAQYEGR